MVSHLTTACFGLLVAILITLDHSSGQQCSMITQSDLGSSTAPSTSGLISSALLTISVENAGSPFVQLFEYHVVCEAIAPTRGTYSYVSLIANYTINSEFRMTQFDFGCTNRNEWNTLVDGSFLSIVTDPPDGSFSTVPRSDCRVCISPRRLTDSDAETHCVPCSNECIGLRQCHTPLNLTCCNYYLDNVCVTNCPSNYVSSSEFECTCSAGFTGSDCTTVINLCDSMPCMNSGSCTSMFGTSYMCQCPEEFTGENCETDVNECSADHADGPCENGGTCTNVFGSYVCACAPEFTGQNCADDVDECLAGGDPPCENGAMCLNTFGGFSCSCSHGYRGALCGDDVDECTSVVNPCQNGGICTNTFGSFVCNCSNSVGFVGDLCNVDVNECLTPDACQNGGTCTNTLGTFTCRCPPGYTGDTCAEDIDECTTVGPALCQNGGSCTNTPGGFECQCTRGFSGATCEDVVDECAGISPCMHGGTCVNRYGGYVCQCGRDWNGQNCEECGIANCTGCFGLNATCSECQQGFVLSNGRCFKERLCIPSCVMGTCINGQCSCMPGFFGIDCSDSCSSRITRCIRCWLKTGTAGEVFCTACETGHELVENECKPLCEDKFCARCENSPLECSQCKMGYILDVKADHTECLNSGSDDIIIIVSIVVAVIGAILLLGLIAFIISGIYKAKERTKMKKAPKTTIFEEYGELKDNPTYVPPEVAIKTTEFAEEVENELYL